MAPRLSEFPTWSLVDARDLPHPDPAQGALLEQLFRVRASAETALRPELNGPMRT